MRLDPKLVQAQGNLMAAYASLGRSTEAIATAEKALALAKAATAITALEEQINVFLFDFRMGSGSSASPPPSPMSNQRVGRPSHVAKHMPKKNQRGSAEVPPRELPAWLALGVLAAAVWLVYGRALDAPLIFDDLLSVEREPRVSRRLWPLVGDADHPGPLRPPSRLPTSARPLVNLSFALNYHFGQLDPRGYRVVNLAAAFANAMLLWAIVWRTLRLPYFGGKFAATAKWLALAVALLWAVHPLVTETVVYVTQRTELMVACFYLATLYCSLRYWSAATPTTRGGWLGAATLACLAGAASKEVMISAPLVVLLFERTFVSGTFREALRRSWPLYVGLLASWLLIFALQVEFAAQRVGRLWTRVSRSWTGGARRRGSFGCI